jgi:hypothetical protein
MPNWITIFRIRKIIRKQRNFPPEALYLRLIFTGLRIDCPLYSRIIREERIEFYRDDLSDISHRPDLIRRMEDYKKYAFFVW